MDSYDGCYRETLNVTGLGVVVLLWADVYLQAYERTCRLCRQKPKGHYCCS